MNADMTALLRKYGQEHLTQFAAELEKPDVKRLLEQINGLNFEQLSKLHRQASQPTLELDPRKISPIEALELPRSDRDREIRARAAAVGLEALLAGRVAVVLVAGGQGSRLGFEHPKGMFPIGPVTGASLFQIHAEKILARGRQAGCPIPWYIMTSPTNNADTRAFFESNSYFGLEKEQVRFFTQGTMPAVDVETGRVLLASKSELFNSPNGHGGSLLAMRSEGVLDDMRRRGCDLDFYFQVDNPFVDVLDPVFIGYHVMTQADISIKVVRKIHPQEKVGLVVRYDGQPTIIEYSDLPDEIAELTSENGELVYWTGSIAIHVFRRSFLEKITEDELGLPFHVARKKVPFVDTSGELINPTEPNAVKFETFVFDCVPRAQSVAVVETARQDEYEPVKNATGEHSPDEVRRAISRRCATWLAAAGIELQRDAQGDPEHALEISPLVALSPDDFIRKVKDRAPVTGPTAWTEKGREEKRS